MTQCCKSVFVMAASTLFGRSGFCHGRVGLLVGRVGLWLAASAFSFGPTAWPFSATIVVYAQTNTEQIYKQNQYIYILNITWLKVPPKAAAMRGNRFCLLRPPCADTVRRLRKWIPLIAAPCAETATMFGNRYCSLRPRMSLARAGDPSRPP